MTGNLIKACPNVLVVQEGGYNVDLMGEHSSGVVKSLILGDYQLGRQGPCDLAFSPTPSDLDVGIKSIDEIAGTTKLDWAVEDINETLKHHKPGWKCLK